MSTAFGFAQGYSFLSALLFVVKLSPQSSSTAKLASIVPRVDYTVYQFSLASHIMCHRTGKTLLYRYQRRIRKPYVRQPWGGIRSTFFVAYILSRSHILKTSRSSCLSWIFTLLSSYTLSNRCHFLCSLCCVKTVHTIPFTHMASAFRISASIVSFNKPVIREGPVHTLYISNYQDNPPSNQTPRLVA